MQIKSELTQLRAMMDANSFVAFCRVALEQSKADHSHVLVVYKGLQGFFVGRVGASQATPYALFHRGEQLPL